MPGAASDDSGPSEGLQPDDEWRGVILFAFETTN